MSFDARDNAVAAFSNGGGWRAAIAPSEVTLGQALLVLPFGHTLFVMDLTGQDMADLMEASVDKLVGGGFCSSQKTCLRSGNCCSDTSIALLDLLATQLKTGTALSKKLDGRITRQ